MGYGLESSKQQNWLAGEGSKLRPSDTLNSRTHLSDLSVTCFKTLHFLVHEKHKKMFIYAELSRRVSTLVKGLIRQQ